ncbi:MAG TPA: UxaA family hydrolase, partial [Pyrinomonadaceae bacterium]|nr:UxaA family hydrolase [Pyrinomonadaceae bacterium]
MTDRQTIPVPISDFAIIVNPDDNVAVVKNETSEGLIVQLPDDSLVTVMQAVPPGHRFATREIPEGDFVRQYGQPIGTSLGIATGEWITHENMTDEVPVV